MYCRLSQQKQFFQTGSLAEYSVKVSSLNKDNLLIWKAYNFQWNSKSYNWLLLWHNRGLSWSMSGKIKTCFQFPTRRKHGQGVRFYKTLTLGAQSIPKKRNLSNRNNLVALPPFPTLSVKFQQYRLPNVQDVKFFNVRPHQNFALLIHLWSACYLRP